MPVSAPKINTPNNNTPKNSLAQKKLAGYLSIDFKYIIMSIIMLICFALLIAVYIWRATTTFN